MKILTLLFFETLFIINALESTFNSNITNSNNNNFFNSNNYLSHQRNNRYNEVQSYAQTNQGQLDSDEENSQTLGKISNNRFHNRPTGRSGNQSSHPSVPVAATLELPNSQKFSDLPITVNNVPVTISRDKIIFPDDKTISSDNGAYTKEENACFSQSKVYYNDSCEEILQDQHCDPGEWLVLDLFAASETPPKIKPKCTKRNCNSNAFYWPKTKSCYENSDRTNYTRFCPPGNKFGNDVFGYGICVCEDLYGLYTNGACYPLYTQGPCSKGYLFVENDSGSTECKINPCRNSSLVLYDGDKNKLCYELGSQGPCKPNVSFQVAQATKKPTCSDNVALLAAIGPPSYCGTDANKTCQPQFKVEDSKKYIDRIISDANKRKGSR